MKKQMTRQTIVLTGASSGIGAALALELAGPHSNLFLAARNLERLELIANQCRDIGAIVKTQILDVGDADAIANWVVSIEEKNQIDIVIANAGTMETCSFDGDLETAQQTHRQIDTNLGGCVNLATAVVPFMEKRTKGQIIFIASIAALQPVADIPGYSASKAGVVAYGEAIYAFLANKGIQVSVICPGFITTPMNIKYKSFRPTEMSAEKAAKRIRWAIEKKKPFYAFPLALLIAIQLGRYLPWWLRRHTNKPFNFTNKPDTGS